MSFPAGFSFFLFCFVFLFFFVFFIRTGYIFSQCHEKRNVRLVYNSYTCYRGTKVWKEEWLFWNLPFPFGAFWRGSFMAKLWKNQTDSSPVSPVWFSSVQPEHCKHSMLHTGSPGLRAIAFHLEWNSYKNPECAILVILGRPLPGSQQNSPARWQMTHTVVIA